MVKVETRKRPEFSLKGLVNKQEHEARFGTNVWLVVEEEVQQKKPGLLLIEEDDYEQTIIIHRNLP